MAIACLRSVLLKNGQNMQIFLDKKIDQRLYKFQSLVVQTVNKVFLWRCHQETYLKVGL